SLTYGAPVSDLILARLTVSLPLALIAIVISTAIAIPVGVFAAAHRGTVADNAIMGASQIGIAFPNFWLGLLLVYLFSVMFRLFPSGGFAGWSEPVAGLMALTLPAIALALPQAAILA